ncbi:MAG: hypothetical protein R3C03_07275 [Pirellulaceae bacterium]
MPEWLVFLWLGLVVIFLISYLGGIISELQRSESLTLDKFLHLPVSTRGIFFLNYVSSSLSLSLCTFFPTMLGLALAMIEKYGGDMIATIPLLLAFFFMVTAVTYQFRGWLAAAMADKRRKRTLIAVGTILLVGLSLTPMFVSRGIERFAKSVQQSPSDELKAEEKDLAEQFEKSQISEEEFEDRIAQIESQKLFYKSMKQEQLKNIGRLVVAVAPPGWLPHGIDNAASKNYAVVLCCLGGMFAIGLFSIVRSYRTTLMIYRGGMDHGVRNAKTSSVVSSTNQVADRNWLNGEFPGLNERQSIVALGTLRALARAPEAKIAIVFPAIILAVLTGTSVIGSGSFLSQDFQAIKILGVGFFVMIGATQMIQNQFGFDRDGFRYYLLAPLEPRDLLIGKNAALLPLAVGLSFSAVIVSQLFAPLKVTHFIATFFQMGTGFMVASLVGNLMSIYVPLAMKSGSLKPANLKFGAAMLQILIFALAPIGMVPAILPLFLEWGAEKYMAVSFPIYLSGAAIYFAVMLFAYRILIRWQADLLYSKRHKILDAVSNTSL